MHPIIKSKLLNKKHTNLSTLILFFTIFKIILKYKIVVRYFRITLIFYIVSILSEHFKLDLKAQKSSLKLI